MPSKTYLNLPKDKKEKLINAAKKEFSRVLLSDASINQIIKEADISRGSFYMYFQDKEDLYAYILKEHRKRGLQTLLDNLKKNKGNIFQSFEDFFALFLNYCLEDQERQFFNNIFLNANLYMESKTFFHCNEDEEEEKILQELEQEIDKKRLTKYAKENISYTFMILFDITIKSVIPVILFHENRKDAQEHFSKLITLIKGGICK